MKLLRNQAFCTYKRLLGVVRPYLTIFIIGVVATFLYSSADSVLIWFIKDITNKVIVKPDRRLVHLLPIILVGAFLLRGLFGFLSSFQIQKTAQHVIHDLRDMLYRKLLVLPATFFDKSSSGSLLAVLTYNVTQVTTASTDAIITILREGALVIGLLVVMFIVSWKLSLILLLTAPFIVFIIHYTSKKMRHFSHQSQDSIGDITAISEEAIQGYKIIRISNAETVEHNKFGLALKNFFKQQLKIVMISSLNSSIVQLVISVPLAIILMLASIKTLNTSPGAFASVIVALITILRPVKRLTSVNEDLQRGIAGAESIFQLLDLPSEIDTGCHCAKNIKGHIRFENVCFKYEKTTSNILSDITLNIMPGEVVALVGHSGAGKTTLVNLLPRFYDICAGAIFIDGVDIHKYDLKNLRGHIAMVSQFPVLFNTSIAENIAYPLCEYSLDEVKHAAEMANATDFISELPDGFATLVGDNGVLLSGGQRQRIAIARAVFRKDPILILDEATSALDTESERAIQQSFDNMYRGSQTTLVIAHRLSTILNADKIVVLNKGRIVEIGDHHDLLQNNRYYAQLYNMQFCDKEAALV